ncbi:hypothetical protein BO79DRAFT_161608, partial [Aspergillus costaricaensis CBS 115574]
PPKTPGPEPCPCDNAACPSNPLPANPLSFFLTFFPFGREGKGSLEKKKKAGMWKYGREIDAGPDRRVALPSLVG